MSEKIFEITHDSLAAKIWEKISAEDRSLLEVKTFIASAYKIYEERGDLLSQKSIAYIIPYEDRLVLTSEVQKFIRRSKRFHRNQNIIFYSLVSLFVLSLIGGSLYINYQWGIAEQKSKALASLNNSINRQQKSLEQKNVELVSFTQTLTKEQAEKDAAFKKIKEDSAKLEAYLKDALLKTKIAEEKTREAHDSSITAQSMRDKASAAVKATEKNLEETKETLRILRLLSTDPTASLKSSDSFYYQTNNKELQHIIRQNAYEAFNEILYSYNLKWNKAIAAIAVSNDMDCVMITDSTRFPKLWNPKTNKLVKLLGHTASATYTCHYEDEENKEGFITVENNKTAIIWNKTGNYAGIKRFTNSINEVVNIPGTNTLLLKYSIRGLGIADLYTNTETIISNDYIKDVQVCKNQRRYSFVTLNNDNIVQFWNKNGDKYISNNGIMLTVPANTNKVTLSPNSRYLAAISDSGMLFYSIALSQKGNIISQSAISLSLPYLRKASFSSNNEIIATTSTGTCYLYNLTNRVTRSLKGHLSGTNVNMLETTPNNHNYLTAGSDNAIKIWDEDITKPIVFDSRINYESDTTPIECNTGRTSLVKDRNGSFILTSGILSNKIQFSKYNVPNANGTNSPWFDTLWLDNTRFELKPNESVFKGMSVVTGITLNYESQTENNFTGAADHKTELAWAIFSKDHQFILVKLMTPGLRKTIYQLYPTFWGMKNFRMLKEE